MRQTNNIAHSIAITSLFHHNLHIFHDVPTTLYALSLNKMN